MKQGSKLTYYREIFDSLCRLSYDDRQILTVIYAETAPQGEIMLTSKKKSLTEAKGGAAKSAASKEQNSNTSDPYLLPAKTPLRKAKKNLDVPSHPLLAKIVTTNLETGKAELTPTVGAVFDKTLRVVNLTNLSRGQSFRKPQKNHPISRTYVAFWSEWQKEESNEAAIQQSFTAFLNVWIKTVDLKNATQILFQLGPDFLSENGEISVKTKELLYPIIEKAELKDIAPTFIPENTSYMALSQLDLLQRTNLKAFSALQEKVKSDQEMGRTTLIISAGFRAWVSKQAETNSQPQSMRGLRFALLKILDTTTSEHQRLITQIKISGRSPTSLTRIKLILAEPHKFGGNFAENSNLSINFITETGQLIRVSWSGEALRSILSNEKTTPEDVLLQLQQSCNANYPKYDGTDTPKFIALSNNMAARARIYRSDIHSDQMMFKTLYNNLSKALSANDGVSHQLLLLRTFWNSTPKNGPARDELLSPGEISDPLLKEIVSKAKNKCSDAANMIQQHYSSLLNQRGAVQDALLQITDAAKNQEELTPDMAEALIQQYRETVGESPSQELLTKLKVFPSDDPENASAMHNKTIDQLRKLASALEKQRQTIQEKEAAAAKETAQAEAEPQVGTEEEAQAKAQTAEKEAATRLQTAFRGKLAVKKVTAMKKEKAQTEAQALTLQAKAAATSIQAAYRRKTAVTAVAGMKEEKAQAQALTPLQTALRGKLAVKKVTAMKKEKAEAEAQALALQAKEEVQAGPQVAVQTETQAAARLKSEDLTTMKSALKHLLAVQNDKSSSVKAIKQALGEWYTPLQKIQKSLVSGWETYAPFTSDLFNYLNCTVSLSDGGAEETFSLELTGNIHRTASHAIQAAADKEKAAAEVQTAVKEAEPEAEIQATAGAGPQKTEKPKTQEVQPAVEAQHRAAPVIDYQATAAAQPGESTALGKPPLSLEQIEAASTKFANGGGELQVQKQQRRRKKAEQDSSTDRAPTASNNTGTTGGNTDSPSSPPSKLSPEKQVRQKEKSGLVEALKAAYKTTAETKNAETISNYLSARKRLTEHLKSDPTDQNSSTPSDYQLVKKACALAQITDQENMKLLDSTQPSNTAAPRKIAIADTNTTRVAKASPAPSPLQSGARAMWWTVTTFFAAGGLAFVPTVINMLAPNLMSLGDAFSASHIFGPIAVALLTATVIALTIGACLNSKRHGSLLFGAKAQNFFAKCGQRDPASEAESKDENTAGV